jgi:hypothetical protein
MMKIYRLDNKLKRFFGIVSLLCISFQINGIELEDIDPFKISKIMMLPQTDYFKQYRIPIVFNYSSQKESEYENEVNRKMMNPNTSTLNMKSSEEFHKGKCKIKEFHYIREIAYTYNPETLIRWESCDSLEIDLKKFKLDGKDELIPIVLKDRIERWKKALSEDIEQVIVKPLPKFIPKIIKGNIQKDAEEYYNILINHIINGEYIGIQIGNEDIDNNENSTFWFNRQIDEFNQYVYGEKLSPGEKKIKIQANSEMLKKLGMSYLYTMMISSNLKRFPAKTQLHENEIVLRDIRIATKNILFRIEKYPKETTSLKNAIKCLEQWPKWHKNNLRMAFYYGFFLDYGKEVRFSEDLKKSSEYWKMAEAIENRIFTSDIFLKRLEIIERDACNVLRISKEEIQGTF